jgi:selenide, water dikinase
MLTDLATGGGCAAKFPAARLERLLKGLLPVESANLLVGLDPADDAAVYKLDDERALVFTIDFFPPLVDDPREFGAIAATNALNDVFAMGAIPSSTRSPSTGSRSSGPSIRTAFGRRARRGPEMRFS